MNAIEADLLRRRPIQYRPKQQLLNAVQTRNMYANPALFDLQMRVGRAGGMPSLVVKPCIWNGVVPGPIVLLRPFDPATALLVQSQHRVNDLTMMAMRDLEARKRKYCHHTVLTHERAGSGQGQKSDVAAFLHSTIPSPGTAARSNDKNKDERRDHFVAIGPNDQSSKTELGDDEIECESKGEDELEEVPKKGTKKEAKWQTMFEELKAYKKRLGDCIVPRGYATNPRLASWVAEQRKQYRLLSSGKSSSITPDRIALLNELDFAWNAQEAAWDRHLSNLRRFQAEHGHCHVPLGHPEFPKLGLWVKEQRRHYSLMKQGKAAHMNAQRAAELDKIGFCWDTHEATWLERLGELADFKTRYGNCLVPTCFTENPKLGTWVHHQRRQYKLFQEGKPSHITPERISVLECIGFTWSPRERSPQVSAQADEIASRHTDSCADSVDSRPQKRQKSSVTD